MFHNYLKLQNLESILVTNLVFAIDYLSEIKQVILLSQASVFVFSRKVEIIIHILYRIVLLLKVWSSYQCPSVVYLLQVRNEE